MVTQIIQGKKNLWAPVHPKRLKELAEFRTSQINNALPELIGLYKDNTNKPSIKMLEGIEGIRTAYSEAFNLLTEEKNEGLWIGDISILIEKFPEVLIEYTNLLKKLKKYKIRELIFGGDSSKLWVENGRKHLKPNHQVKYIDHKGGMTDQLIIGNKIFSFSMNKNLFTIVTEGPEIAKTQKMLFDTIWNKS